MNIDPINETVTLDKLKTIEVAKIITNEERLYQRVQELEAILSALNDSVQITAVRYAAALKKVEALAGEIYTYQQTINNLTEEELALEKKRRRGRLYGFGMVGFAQGPNIPSPPSIDLGLNWSRPKISYLLAVDPFTFEKPVIKAGLGFKIL